MARFDTEVDVDDMLWSMDSYENKKWLTPYMMMV